MLFAGPNAPEPMHIPDGFLSAAVSILLWGISALVIAFALRRVNRDLGERQVPMLGVLAAAIFAGQMLNFTVAGGTSGHLMGTALATILIGPWAAVLVMTTVVGVQALIFQDGGLLALGANIFNLAIVGAAVSYFVFQTFTRLAGGKRWSIFVSGFLAAWASIFIASLAVGLQLALSGTSPANIAVPAMAAIHALIGVGEGLVTVGVLAFIQASRPDLVQSGRRRTVGGSAIWIAGLLLAIGLAVLSPIASSRPDGLEWVAGQQGFLNTAREPLYSLLPDYLFPGVGSKAAATVIAGILGTLIVFGVAFALARYRRNREPEG